MYKQTYKNDASLQIQVHNKACTWPHTCLQTHTRAPYDFCTTRELTIVTSCASSSPARLFIDRYLSTAACRVGFGGGKPAPPPPPPLPALVPGSAAGTKPSMGLLASVLPPSDPGSIGMPRPAIKLKPPAWKPAESGPIPMPLTIWPDVRCKPAGETSFGPRAEPNDGQTGAHVKVNGVAATASQGQHPQRQLLPTLVATSQCAVILATASDSGWRTYLLENR